MLFGTQKRAWMTIVHFDSVQLRCGIGPLRHLLCCFLAEFRHRQVSVDLCVDGELDNEPHTRLRYFCSPQHTRERTLFHDPKADDGFRRRPAANPDKMVFGPRGRLSTDLDFTSQRHPLRGRSQK